MDSSEITFDIRKAQASPDPLNVLYKHFLQKSLLFAGIPKCFDTFTRRENTQLLGGREITPISGRAQCQQLCLCNPNCTAYEWQSNKRECWHHTGQTDNTRNNNELDLYVRVRCKPIVPGECQYYLLMVIW